MADVEGHWTTRKGAASRAALIDAAEQLMREEGYAAVTSRRVAKKAGVGNQLVHYYFRNMDDLYLAVFHREIDESFSRFETMLESPQPLRGIWQFITDPRGTAFTAEFSALASHNEAIRAEIARYAEEFRHLLVKALERHLAERGVKPRLSTLALSVIVTSIAAALAREAALGIHLGHDETEALIENALLAFEERAAPEKRPGISEDSDL